MKWFAVATVSLFSFSLTSLEPTILGGNKFLDKLASPEILSILIVILTVTLASVANIHLTLGRMQKSYMDKGLDIRDKIADARRELTDNAWYLFGCFCIILVALIVKGHFESMRILSACHAIALVVITMNLAILYDIYASVYLLASSGELDS